MANFNPMMRSYPGVMSSFDGSSQIYAPTQIRFWGGYAAPMPPPRPQPPSLDMASLMAMLRPLLAQLMAPRPQPVPAPRPVTTTVTRPVPRPLPRPVVTPVATPLPVPLPPPITTPVAAPVPVTQPLPIPGDINGPLEDFYPVTPVLAMGGIPGGLLNLTLEGTVIGAVAPGGSSWSPQDLVTYYNNSLNPQYSLVTDTTVVTGRNVAKAIYQKFNRVDTSGDGRVDEAELKVVAARTGNTAKLELADFQSLA